MQKLVDILIQRGDKLSIVNGCLVVKAASGKEASSKWIEDNQAKIILQLNQREEALKKSPKDQTVNEWLYCYCK
jgi:peptidyl-tRNA hydrolase